MGPPKTRPAGSAGETSSPNLERMLQTKMKKMDAQSKKVDEVAAKLSAQQTEIDKMKRAGGTSTPAVVSAKERAAAQSPDTAGSTRKDLTEALG